MRRSIQDGSEYSNESAAPRHGAVKKQAPLPTPQPDGSASGYTLSQWPSVLIFIEDAGLEIDNNLVENASFPGAIGKKNWLLIKDAAAGERIAILYTVIESFRQHSIDAQACLRAVLTALPSMTSGKSKTGPQTPPKPSAPRAKRLVAIVVAGMLRHLPLRLEIRRTVDRCYG